MVELTEALLRGVVAACGGTIGKCHQELLMPDWLGFFRDLDSNTCGRTVQEIALEKRV